MSFEPDPDQVQRIAWAISALGFLIAILGLVGEVAGRAVPVSRAAEALGLGQMLGWWNDIGELAITVGTMVGAFAGIGGLFHGSSRTQVEAVGRRVESVREVITGEEGVVSELDVVQAELDAQTGVLEEQLKVLDRIDGRLDG